MPKVLVFFTNTNIFWQEERKRSNYYCTASDDGFQFSSEDDLPTLETAEEAAASVSIENFN